MYVKATSEEEFALNNAPGASITEQAYLDARQFAVKSISAEANALSSQLAVVRQKMTDMGNELLRLQRLHDKSTNFEEREALSKLHAELKSLFIKEENKERNLVKAVSAKLDTIKKYAEEASAVRKTIYERVTKSMGLLAKAGKFITPVLRGGSKLLGVAVAVGIANDLYAGNIKTASMKTTEFLISKNPAGALGSFMAHELADAQKPEDCITKIERNMLQAELRKLDPQGYAAMDAWARDRYLETIPAEVLGNAKATREYKYIHWPTVGSSMMGSNGQGINAIENSNDIKNKLEGWCPDPPLKSR